MKYFACLVAGSRSFDNFDFMCKQLDYLLSIKVQQGYQILIVAGAAKGADALAAKYAKLRGYYLEEYPADWSVGKRGGYLRNRKMHERVSQFAERGCVCFWDGQSRGTAQNFDLAKEFNTQLRVVRFQ